MTPPRFILVTPTGLEPVKALSPETLLSKALTRASASTEEGEWRVREYDDDLYIVRREAGVKASIFVGVPKRAAA